MRRFAFLTLCLLLLAPAVAHAGVVARVDLSSQRMDVFVNGAARASWAVSTARRGYRTPSGSYRPYLLKRIHYSSKYHNSPMPYSIFFAGGYAIHGSYEIGNLGRPVSHGCIRLHPAAAAQLYSLVQANGRGNTRIVITR